MKYHRTLLIVLCLLIFTSYAPAQANKDNDPELAQALEFIRTGRHLNALPLLEKAAPRYPNDAEVQAHFGVAILLNSVTVKDEEQRRKEFVRGSEILRKAKKLGTENVTALHFLDKIEAGMQVDVGFSTSNKDVEDAIREGESFFGRGEYEKAFTAYKRAYDLDPENYEAAVFAGDCYYSLKRYKESEAWFAKAVSIDKNNEVAYRFWGDALLYQKKIPEAVEKFADAIIAEPDSRLAWGRFWETVREHAPRKSSPFISAPGSEESDSYLIVIDPKLLKADDGTANWASFTQTRERQKKDFEKAANGRKFAPTVSEDVQALKSVAVAVNLQLKNKKIVKLDPYLENLLKLNELDLLDAYVILYQHNGNESPEYQEYRQKNWHKLRQFLVEYIAGFKPVDRSA
ncbi:MAG TPA: tetratricopeptide repeat protein [Pyrinomonadaceae bacterium]|jgi:tetratricopeptide (TPR) repeat protein|nr:tetratricopeptide repeat protein [Pyrinomonadaceae bacterium]